MQRPGVSTGSVCVCVPMIVLPPVVPVASPLRVLLGARRPRSLLLQAHPADLRAGPAVAAVGARALRVAAVPAAAAVPGDEERGAHPVELRGEDGEGARRPAEHAVGDPGGGEEDEGATGASRPSPGDWRECVWSGSFIGRVVRGSVERSELGAASRRVLHGVVRSSGVSCWAAASLGVAGVCQM